MAKLRIEVVYALSVAQTVARMTVAPGTTVREAVEKSGVLHGIPAGSELGYGIFGRRASPDQPLSDGDRIEIYRPLRLDPRRARRARAKSRGGAKR
jgi:putative ubiquitin-RnfH superfamily antitoxin RatB of RatAB toxin-antitoxin module